MAARIGNVAFDCGDVLATARFWSEVLDLPLDEGSSAEFATIGGTDPGRAEPVFYFNKVDEVKRAKNRVHLDLTDPEESVIDRLITLGASVVDSHRLGSHRWTVIHDPEGSEFCVAPTPFTG